MYFPPFYRYKFYIFFIRSYAILFEAVDRGCKSALLDPIIVYLKKRGRTIPGLNLVYLGAIFLEFCGYVTINLLDIEVKELNLNKL